MKVIRLSFSRLFFLFLVFILLAACSPSSGTLTTSDSRIINNGSSFGQSFTAKNDGLSGISILLGPTASLASGSLIFHLRTDPQSQEDIALARLPLSEVNRKDYYKFDFEAQRDSQGKHFYLEVDAEDGGEVEIFTAEADSYLDGALYENHTPQDRQLGFRLEYDQKYYLLGLINQSFQWIFAIGVGLFAFIIPGWAIFSLFWRDWDGLIWPSKLGLACGLSIAIYPLFFLWTDLVGLHLGQLYAWLPPIGGLLALSWKNRRLFSQFPAQIQKKIRILQDDKAHRVDIALADIAFLGILFLIIVSRFWVIRNLEIPLYGDSYQHSMIVQLMVDNNGLFDSWEPYANLTTFTYHFGFHSNVAVYTWLSGLTVEKAMLWTGQLLNIFAILGLYPLAYKLIKNRWAGVIAVLIGGLLSPMPMSYVNWGRYTQLAGQVLLPVAIWTGWSLLDRPFPEWKSISWLHKLINYKYLGFDIASLSVAWLALSGVALTHYRILILVIIFYPAYVFLTLSRKNNLEIFGRIIWILIGGAVLSAPWYIHILGGRLITGLVKQMTSLPPIASTNAEVFQGIGNLQTYLPIVLWIIFVFCLGVSFWRQRRDIAIIALWWFLIILATNPAWLGLPGNGVISNFTTFIAFYIPTSLVIAYTLIDVQISVNQKIFDSQSKKYRGFHIILPALMVLVICLIGFWGVRNRIKDLDLSRYELVTQPDLRAMKWIKDNTNLDDKFLVNAFFAYNNSLVVGSDGGWWIPLLTGRKSTLPPLTYGIEAGAKSTDFQDINELNREIINKGINHPDVISMLKKQGIKYVFIGQRQGAVNNNGQKVLNPEVMLSDPNFEVKYNQDRVWIFELLQ